MVIDEEDRGIVFISSSPSFWVAWIGPPNVSLELTAGSNGCQPWRRWSTKIGWPVDLFIADVLAKTHLWACGSRRNVRKGCLLKKLTKASSNW
ncbi:hypothetical protein ACLOJK_023033 [Asimina triloba]